MIEDLPPGFEDVTIIEDQSLCMDLIKMNKAENMLDVMNGRSIATAALLKPTAGLVIAYPKAPRSVEFKLEAYMFKGTMNQFTALRKTLQLAEYIAKQFDTKPILKQT